MRIKPDGGAAERPPTCGGEGAARRRRARSSVALVWMIAGAVALTAACKHRPPPGAAMADELDGAPEWVSRGCAAYWGDDDGARICGVGAVAGTRNAALARTAAMGRARAEIARSLQTKVRAMLKDYSSTTTGGDEFGIAAADEQTIDDVSKQITSMTLSGTALQDTWISNNGTLYTLVALDVERFNDSISGMTNLSESIRTAVRERADAAFRELDEETGVAPMQAERAPRDAADPPRDDRPAPSQRSEWDDGAPRTSSVE